MAVGAGVVALAVILVTTLAASPTPVASSPLPPAASSMPTSASAPTATASPTDAPTSTPTARTPTVRVASIADLLDALGDDHVTEIIVADGTYDVSPASLQRPDSLWIGSRYADREQPIVVRAETRGGVTFDGGGTTYFGCISFEEGAHHQTWDGFRCANGQATGTGAITIGGHGGRAAPHHLVLRSWAIDATVTGRATTRSADTLDHAVYVAEAIGGPHDLVFEDFDIDGRGGLASAFHFFHGDDAGPGMRNAWNVTIRRLTVTGTQQAIILWEPTLRDITIDGARISDALSVAVRYESPGATGITLANIASTGSGSGRGFQSSLGSSPDGVTFVHNSFE
jgi:hypothetical protein